jgi:hypothetical protein
MMMVEYFANTPTCALGGADADVLAGDGCTLADIASGVERVKGDKVARTFPNTLGRRSSALGGSFADVPGAPTDVATGAALLGLPLGGRLRRVGRLRQGLSLAVLTGGVLAANGKCECEERAGWFWERGSHGLNLLSYIRCVGTAFWDINKRECTRPTGLHPGFPESASGPEGPMVVQCDSRSGRARLEALLELPKVPELSYVFSISLSGPGARFRASSSSALRSSKTIWCIPRSRE